MDAFKLDNQVAIITGAEEVVKGIEADGGKATAVVCDVTDDNALKTW